MELVEREQFLIELEAMLGDVASGKGRFVLVSGEAGIGKTSLVEQFAEAHKTKARVLWGACDALFTPRPLGPLYDIAQQTQGNLLALLEGEGPRASIFSAALDEMGNRPAPSITVIEDLHWADEATLDLLKFLGRRINRINSMLDRHLPRRSGCRESPAKARPGRVAQSLGRAPSPCAAFRSRRKDAGRARGPSH